MSKIQNSDVKSESELIAAGATKSSLINDSKIYVSANSINKTLDDAITDGDIGGGVALDDILFVNYTFSGDGINSTFVLGTQVSNPLSGVSNISGVYLNGIMQVPDEDYFVQLPDEVVFYATPPITSKVHVVMVSL